MIDYALWNLEKAGITDVIVVVRYLGEQLRKYIEASDLYGELEIKVPNVDPLDTADALRKVANLVEGEQILISMADIVTNISISDFIGFHESKDDAYASITLKDMEQPRRFGVIMVDRENRIQLFLEKPLSQELYLTSLTFAPRETLDLHANLVNTGIYCFDFKILEILDAVPDLMDFGKHVFPYILQESLPFYGYIRDYYWMDCGNVQSFLWTNYDLVRRWAWPFLPNGNEQNGRWTGKNVTVGPHSIVEIETAIGDNTIIGKDTRITSGSVIGNNCRIGDNCLINSSVLWENAVIGDNVHLSECVICDGVKIGSNVSIESLAAVGTESEITEGTTLKEGSTIESAMIVKGKET